MSSLLRPVGPLPAAVYWRRRAAALLLLMLVVALLWWLIGALFGSGGGDAGQPVAGNDASSSPTATVSTGPSPSVSPASSPAASASGTAAASPSASTEVPLCPDSALTISVRTDKASYAPGQEPLITLKVTNSSSAACRRDLGSAALELQVKAGTVREWSSDDCNPGGAPKIETLQPGDSDSVTVTWNRLRSAPDCPEGLGAAPAGAYQAIGRAGTLIGGQADFRLE